MEIQDRSAGSTGLPAIRQIRKSIVETTWDLFRWLRRGCSALEVLKRNQTLPRQLPGGVSGPELQECRTPTAGTIQTAAISCY
jgi:hypothetical protein